MALKTILILIITITLALAVALGAGIFFIIRPAVILVDSFEKCVAAGYPVMESYPEQCRTPEGVTFTKNAKPTQAIFGEKFTLAAGEHISFSDGLLVTLVKVLDSRCPKNVQCVWAGELSYQFLATGGSAGKTGQQFYLSDNAKKATTSGYVFSLENSTEASASVIVTKE